MKFGIRTTTSFGTIDIVTLIGKIIFHIVPTDTLFLLLFQDLDILGVMFDNLQNVFIQKGKYMLIIKTYNYPWMFLSKIKALIYLNQDLVDNTTAYYLIEVEFCCLYYCFGYFLIGCFYKILERTGYKTNFKELKRFTEYCK
jgi:hypothetical protein